MTPARSLQAFRLQFLAPLLLLLAGASCSKSSPSENVEVQVTPASSTVSTGGTLQLQAQVTGTQDTRVQWEVSSGGGTVSSDGLYTAPAQEDRVQIRATSLANPQAFAYAQVTVVAAPPQLGLTLLPANRRLGVQEAARFEIQISNGTGTEQLEWKIEEGSQGGTVSDAGNLQLVYYAPATPGTFHLLVNVQGRPEVSARATLTVTQERPTPTLRGTIHYAGQKTGRVYVVFVWGELDGFLQAKLTTSLAAPGAYSLTPLRSTSSPTAILAFMDTLGTGLLNLTEDPMALVPLQLTGEDQSLDVTLVDPSQPPSFEQQNPWSSPTALGWSDGLLVAFGSAFQVPLLHGELADSYKIYWSQQQDPGPSNFVGSLTVPANRWLLEYGHVAAVPGLAPGQYYVGVAPLQNGVEGAVNVRVSPVEVGGSPGTGATLSGTVQLEAPAAAGQLYVMASQGTNLRATRVPASTASVSWSIPGLAEGDYTVWAMLDADGDGFPERVAPRIEARPRVSVSGTGSVSAPDISFAPVISRVRATTLQQPTFFSAGAYRAGGIFYTFAFLQGSQQLVGVRLTGGQEIPTPYDVPGAFALPFSGSLQGVQTAAFWLDWYALDESAALPTQAQFTAELHNGDGSTDSIPVNVPPVLPMASLTAPVDNTTTSATPTLSWNLPMGLPGSVTQRLTVQENNPFGKMLWNRMLPLSQTQITYNDDGKAEALLPGTTYFWQLELADDQGDLSRATGLFQVQ